MISWGWWLNPKASAASQLAGFFMHPSLKLRLDSVETILDNLNRLSPMISWGWWLNPKACAASQLAGFFMHPSLKLRLDSVCMKKPYASRKAFLLVGMARFELTTPCTPCKCATGLRYIPIVLLVLLTPVIAHGNGSPLKGRQN